MATGLILWGKEDPDQELMTKRRSVELHLVKGREHAKGVIRLDYDLATQQLSERLTLTPSVSSDDVFTVK